MITSSNSMSTNTETEETKVNGSKAAPSNTAIKYAEAMMARDATSDTTAFQRESSEKHRQEMERFLTIWQESKNLENILRSPMLPVRYRANLLAEIAQALNLSEKVSNLLVLLLVERKIHLLPSIISAHKKLEMEAAGEQDVEIYSPIQLSESQKEKLLHILQERLQSRLKATFLEDPTLLAGVKVVAGNTIFDGSLLRQLSEIRANMPTLDWGRDHV